MLSCNLRRYIMICFVISLASFVTFQSSQSFGAQTWKYMGNAGCKCHLSKGCFEGEEYKKMKNQHYNTFSRLETDEDKSNPECLKCHATAYGMKIKKGKSKQGSKDFIEDVGCEACHGPGEGYIDVKKNYNKKGKDAFKELLEKDPMTARKVQYDAGLLVAGINQYKTIKEQCLNCHWEDANAKNKCPKCEGKENSQGDPRLFTDKYIKADDHRDHDSIDDVLPKVDKKKWKGYIEQDPWYQTRPPNAK